MERSTARHHSTSPRLYRRSDQILVRHSLGGDVAEPTFLKLPRRAYHCIKARAVKFVVPEEHGSACSGQTSSPTSSTRAGKCLPPSASCGNPLPPSVFRRREGSQWLQTFQKTAPYRRGATAPPNVRGMRAPLPASALSSVEPSAAKHFASSSVSCPLCPCHSTHPSESAGAR